RKSKKKESDKTVTEAMRGVTDLLSWPGVSAGLTKQITEARTQSAKNYDLEAMKLLPMTGYPLWAAGKLVTGDSGWRQGLRGYISRKTFRDIGVEELKAFAGSLDVDRMKWPIYAIDEETGSSQGESDLDPSQDGTLDRRTIRTYHSIEEYHKAFKEGQFTPVDFAS
ncbi:hypothetical protein FOZ62_013486, partial [Perkinsus olseni]